jgi:hypothetical protein
MKVLTLRGLDEDLSLALKKAAQREGISVNRKVLILLQESLGLKKKNRLATHHDLDDLAGTWDPAEEKEFLKKTKGFDAIDRDLWK